MANRKQYASRHYTAHSVAVDGRRQSCSRASGGTVGARLPAQPPPLATTSSIAAAQARLAPPAQSRGRGRGEGWQLLACAHDTLSQLLCAASIPAAAHTVLLDSSPKILESGNCIRRVERRLDRWERRRIPSTRVARSRASMIAT